jgi:enoyl-CoA hydratase/carnithine racemase
MAQTVVTERDGRVLLVRLDNPPRNFMTGAMVAELDAVARSLEGDSSIGAVVLTGAADRIFITHYDVEEILAGMEGMGTTLSPTVAGGALRVASAARRIPGGSEALARTPAGGLVELRRIHDLFERMNRSDKTWIAAINGVAMGGGCELALACDLRIMADGDGPIGLPEATLGLIPGAGGTQRLSRLLGSGRALELMLEGRGLTPAQAGQLGVVHRVVPPEALLDEARTTAHRLARRSPATVAAIKRAVYEGASQPLGEGLHVERAGFLSASGQPAALKAMRAYVEEVRSLGDVDPGRVPELMAPWREGTAVDMVGQ